MTQEEIKRHRVESILKEIIPEALGTLDDPLLNTLGVTDVVCSKGRSDAKVYLDKSVLNADEQKLILKKLHSLSNYIQNHCKQAEGWFKAPYMTFEFDEQPDKISHLEKLFAKIHKEIEGDDEK
jgi:ribosome-binding factor A